MTALQEQLPLFEKEQTHYTQNPNFKHFVRNMFDENCAERRDCGQKEFADVFEYFRAYPVWLEKQYNNRKNDDKKNI